MWISKHVGRDFIKEKMGETISIESDRCVDVFGSGCNHMLRDRERHEKDLV